MNSRMEKYYNDDTQEYSRSKRNSNLYKEVYGSYSSFEHLPVSDNVSEIDAEKLKEIVTSREEYHRSKNTQIKQQEPIKRYEENKVYDINELIEKARKSKPRVVEEKKEHIESYNFLKTLESNELLKSQIKEVVKETPEIKEENIITNNIEKTNTLSLEILSDLKPSEDTVVMEAVSNGKTTNSDIPIEQSIMKEEEEKPFYSGSYKFSKKDFFDDEYKESKKGSSFAKALLIIIVLSICITGIYFLIDFLGSR